MNDPIAPLDRQRDEDGNLEPNLWYDRFTYFRLMGPDRSFLGLVNRWREQKGREKKNTVPGAWTIAGKRWNWIQRAEAWDAEERRKRIAVDEQARADMLRKHIELAHQLQDIGRGTLIAIQEQEAQLEAKEARYYIKDGVQIERQARGLPEYLIEVAQMTDDELRAEYADLLAKVGGGQSDDEEEGVASPSSHAAKDRT